METKRTTYDTLPEQIDYLISEIREVKELLIQRIEKPEEIPKYLDKEQALRYLKRMGYVMSSSKLYKMTQVNDIPCHRIERKLYFLPTELSEWLNNRIGEREKMSRNLSNQSIQLIIKSAQHK
jgi:hypothetical protein|nr:helix-turn-helix domain-containing protein [Bacteroides intestinalis]